jgi:two-component system, cell cycle sensor histidine kinase and response regulator CckA
MASVLVVDDNAVNRDLVVTLLGYRGHRVVEAADGAEALATARAERPDLVITDLLMPVIDGYELIREIRADPMLSATPVIFYTANYVHAEVAPVAAALGVRHIVEKPIDPRDLLLAVDDALAHGGPAPSAPPETFRREHLRALSTKLVGKVQELEDTQDELSRSEARFRSLAEFAPVGIFSASGADSVMYANPQLREIFGLPDGGAENVNWASLIHPDDRDRWIDAALSAMEQRRSHGDRIRLVRPDGTQRWVQIQMSPVVDDADQATFVGTVQDVTSMIEAQREREDMANRLQIAERLDSVGQLAAGIAHDFNNLLAVIVNYTHFVSKGLEEAAQANPHARWTQMHEDTDAIRDAADRAADLTHRLLVFGSRDVAHPELVDVNEVVRSALELLGRTIGEHVQFEHHLDEQLQPVLSDRGQLEQVLVNLVANSRDAVGAGGGVAIRTDNVDLDEQTAAMHVGLQPGSFVRVTVTDDGAGMAPETIARAFEPFFTTKPTGHGTGLGLATVYGIVTRLNGSVSIYSEPGRGTSMRVYLPAAKAACAAVAAEPTQSSGDATGAGEVILVSEDDDQIRAIAARILTENGYSVIAVDRGAAALAVLGDEASRVDLLLSDVIMPQMSGRELADRAAVARPALPVLFMSGYADGLFTPGKVTAPGVDLLEKPFTQSSLLAAVARALVPR